MNKFLSSVWWHLGTLVLFVAAYFSYGASSAGVGGPILAVVFFVAGLALEGTAWNRTFWSRRKQKPAA